MLDGWDSNPRPIGYTSSTIFIAAWTISSPSPISDHVGIVRVRSSSPEPKKCSYKVLPEGIVSEPFSIYGRTYVSLSRRVLLCTPKIIPGNLAANYHTDPHGTCEGFSSCTTQYVCTRSRLYGTIHFVGILLFLRGAASALGLLQTSIYSQLLYR